MLAGPFKQTGAGGGHQATVFHYITNENNIQSINFV